MVQQSEAGHAGAQSDLGPMYMHGIASQKRTDGSEQKITVALNRIPQAGARKFIPDLDTADNVSGSAEYENSQTTLKELAKTWMT